MIDDVATIEALAQRLRCAMESVPRATLPLGMRDFPVASCGDASQLLGAYLADSGIHGFAYVCGRRGSKDDGTWTSHAWLERAGVVVDITADQFIDAPAPVIVEESSSWHSTFTTEDPRPR